MNTDKQKFTNFLLWLLYTILLIVILLLLVKSCENDKLKERVEELSMEITQSENTIEDIKKVNKDLIVDNSNLNIKLTDISRQLDSLKKVLALQMELNKITLSKLNNWQQKHNTIKEQLQTVTLKLYRAKINSLNEHRDLVAQINKLQNDTIRLLNVIDSINHHRDNLVTVNKNRSNIQNNELSDLSKSLIDCYLDTFSLSQELDRLNALSLKQNEKNAALQNEKKDLEQRIDNFKRTLAFNEEDKLIRKVEFEDLSLKSFHASDFLVETTDLYSNTTNDPDLINKIDFSFKLINIPEIYKKRKVPLSLIIRQGTGNFTKNIIVNSTESFSLKENQPLYYTQKIQSKLSPGIYQATFHIDEMPIESIFFGIGRYNNKY